MTTRPEVAPVVDAMTAEIVRNALVAITDEMKTNLLRTAYNEIIYEALDFTVGLFDADGNTVSIGLGLPMFIRGLSDVVKAKLAFYGPHGIEPGDVLLTNDAYITGSHLNHMTFTLPIFWDGEIVAFAATMAHWQEVGGVLGGKTTDIYSEGLQLPIVKAFTRGEQNKEIVDVIRANVRFPDKALGDYRAQIGALRTGERRMLDLLRRHGAGVLRACIGRIFDQSERLARASVARLPDGVYEAASFMDDDGIRLGHIPIRVRVTIEGDEMTVDLTDVSPQVSGYFNSGETAGRGAAQVAFKCLTTPLLLPINDGSFRPLTVILPPGRVVSARRPAAMRWWMTIPMTVVDTIIRAVSPAMPQETIAGHHADLCASTLFGVDHRTGYFFFQSGGLPGGGWGAKSDEDGISATVCINDGDTHNSPVESSEAKGPVIFDERSLRPDSGGPGRFRGGLGVRTTMRVRTQTRVNTFMERTQDPPWGLFGGLPGLPNRLTVERAAGQVETFPNGKLDAYALEEGDAYVMESGGGGGFGAPLDRSADLVARDVRAGYVSAEAARNLYGVVLLPGGCTVDVEATERLRAAGRPLPDDPRDGTQP